MSPDGPIPGRATLDAEARARFSLMVERVAVFRDRQAFADLFAYYAPRVKSFLLRLGSTEAQAEELAQDVMVTVWRKAELYDRAQASVSTWIFRIARNRRIDILRRENKPALDGEDPMLQPSELAPPETLATLGQMEDAVREALATLPDDQADLIRAAYFDGLSQTEIAEAFKLPLGTVKSRFRLAFEKLRSRLGEWSA